MSAALKQKLAEMFDALPSETQAEVIDFVEYKLQKQQKQAKKRNDKPRIAGLNRGQIWMSEDFNDPMPDEFWGFDEDIDPIKRQPKTESEQAENR